MATKQQKREVSKWIKEMRKALAYDPSKKIKKIKKQVEKEMKEKGL